jgi:hypothetical protein
MPPFAAGIKDCSTRRVPQLRSSDSARSNSAIARARYRAAQRNR